MLELVDELRRADGLTVISTMHDLTLAGRFAQRFALLSGGRLVAEGTRGEVLRPHVIAEHYGARVRVDRRRDARLGRRPARGTRSVTDDQTDRTPTDEPPTRRPVRASKRVSSRVLVHTGAGKGKSSAAMGVMLRAVSRRVAGRGGAVREVGRVAVRARRRSAAPLGVDWWSRSATGSRGTREDLDRRRGGRRARAGADASALIAAGEHRLVVLDEITYPMTWGWIDTGGGRSRRSATAPTASASSPRGATRPPSCVEIADTVTEMVSVKHAFDQGIAAMRGIEF